MAGRPRIADHTQALPRAGAVHVDPRLAAVAHKVGVALTESCSATPWTPTTPSRPRRGRSRPPRPGTWTCTPATRTVTGTIDVVASADTADTLDLEAAVAQAAADLAAGGSTDSLDVRRSMALGVIARHYLAATPSTPAEPRPGR